MAYNGELHEHQKDPRYQELCTKQIIAFSELSIAHAMERIELQEQIEREQKSP